jgi:hypothetical protein
VRALELLGKYLRIWTDGPAVTVNAVQCNLDKLSDCDLDTLTQILDRAAETEIPAVVRSTSAFAESSC